MSDLNFETLGNRSNLVGPLEAKSHRISAAGDGLDEGLHKASHHAIKDALSHMNAVKDLALNKGIQLKTQTNEYVHDRPWRFIGMAAVTGFILGFAASRKD